MALDTSKLRKRLPAPPTDGNPAMDRPAPVSRPSPTPGGAPQLDGRSLRATGRTVQLNLKVSPDIKARFLALAESRQQLMAVVFEEAIAALEARKDGI